MSLISPQLNSYFGELAVSLNYYIAKNQGHMTKSLDRRGCDGITDSSEINIDYTVIENNINSKKEIIQRIVTFANFVVTHHNPCR